jgi:histidine ammonia-lyase
MATFAARRLGDLADHVATILAIELLAAAQGVDLRAHPTSPALREVVALVRAHVPHYDLDRYFAPDIAAVKRLVQGGRFAALSPFAFPSEAA